MSQTIYLPYFEWYENDTQEFFDAYCSEIEAWSVLGTVVFNNPESKDLLKQFYENDNCFAEKYNMYTLKGDMEKINTFQKWWDYFLDDIIRNEDLIRRCTLREVIGVREIQLHDYNIMEY